MTPAVVALDVGGTGMKCALVRPGGGVHHTERHPTPATGGPAAVVAAVLAVATRLADRARRDGLDPVAAGVVVPGVVDEAAGTAVWSSNLGFRDVPLRSLLAGRLGLPAALGHDVRAGGVAEARLGAGRGEPQVLFVAIGTGIAAAHVLDGRALTGTHGAAGELGHVIVRPGGPPCACGAHGCLESIASAAAIGRRYTDLSGTAATAADVAARAHPVTAAGLAASADPHATSPDLLAASADPHATSPDLLAASADPHAASPDPHAASPDPLAVEVWQDAVEALADGLTTAQALYDTGVVVLGGGLAEAGDALLTPLRSALDRRRTFHRAPRLVRAELGDTAGCLGAALLALDQVR